MLLGFNIIKNKRIIIINFFNIFYRFKSKLIYNLL